MKEEDPEGFIRRKPGAKRIHRSTITSAGSNDEWSCDGHDKMMSIGFPLWGVRDVCSRNYLGLFCVPNNRLATVIAYLWLSVVYELGGGFSSLVCRRWY